jgi:chemotaxis receptor (MCP) glutamine deamidase CheD/CheY-like chemotaxis protein
MKEEHIFLLPGEVEFLKTPGTIGTVLGSCVAVCLFDRVTGFGGMNHYMLPLQGNNQNPLAKLKYGNIAIPKLIALAKAAGSNVKNLDASIFGGSNPTQNFETASQNEALLIGERNIECARKILGHIGIPIVKEEIKHEKGCKVSIAIPSGKIKSTSISTPIIPKKDLLKNRKIRVLIVDDSPVVRKVIAAEINKTDDMEVAAMAANPYEAREHMLVRDPDVICLDLIMPRMDGLSFLKKLMKFKPIPTVVVSTIAKKGGDMTKKVLQAGAVDAIDKEDLQIHKGGEILKKVLIAKLRQAALR